ncbi:MAG: HAD-IA family hydrolase [Spirochaetota bacterium]
MDKWLVFDMMGVIFKDPDDISACLIPYLNTLGCSYKRELVEDLYAKLRVGSITTTEFWRNFQLENRDREYLLSRLRVDHEALQSAEKYARTYHFNLGIISNDASEWSEILRSHYGINKLFRNIVISGDVGMRKPNPAIYREFLKRIPEKNPYCMYIDDNAAYLQTAKAFGWLTIRFCRDWSYHTEGSYDYSIDKWTDLNPIIIEAMRKNMF